MLDQQVQGLVDAVIAAKWERIEVSRALHEPLADIGGAQLVSASAVKVSGSSPKFYAVAPMYHFAMSTVSRC